MNVLRLLSVLLVLLCCNQGYAASGYSNVPVWAQQNRPLNAPLSVPAFDKIYGTAQQAGSVKVIVRLAAPPALSQGFQIEADIKEHGNVTAQQTAIQAVQDTIAARVSAKNADKIKRFKHIPFMALEVDSAELTTLLNSPEIDLIEEDIPVPADLSQSVPLIGADTAGTFGGFTGQGQTVAILDTGVDKTHSFLAGKVVDEACFSSTYSPQAATTVCPNGQTSQTGAGAGVNCNTSVNGCLHGTHVAGITAGNGNGFSGVAKDAKVLAVQVFSRFDSSASCGGVTPCAMSYTSDQISALDWVYSKRSTYNISSVNMSLGGGSYTTYCDSSNTAQKASIDTLRAAGIATIIASGNSSYTSSISAPACISSAISVGATDKSDVVASYSNSASILNLLAPGSAINSSIPGGSFAAWNGTSMATPHVAGAWAVMKSKNPSATVDQVLTSLTSTGVPVTDGRNGITKPRINLYSALSPSLPSTLAITVNQVTSNACPFVNAYVTTTSDKDLNYLTTSNFSLLQDGVAQPVSSVQYLGNSATSSSAISFVLDYSGSMMGQSATDMATSTKNFISNLGANDVGEVVKFSTAFDTQGFNNDKNALISQIDASWALAWNSTYMYDALYKALQDTSAQPSSYRKALVLLTDGVSSTNVHTKAEVVTLANSLGIPIFTIGIGTYLDSTTLMDLALQAGGSYFAAPTAADIVNIYQKISNIIKSEYLLRFSDVKLDSSSHSLTIGASVPGTTGTLTATNTGSFTSCQGLFPVTVTLDPSVPSPQLSGVPVTFTAIGSGGTGSYNYEFYLQAPGSTTFTKAKAYSTSNSWAWNTTGLATGNYTVRVWVKSAGASPSSGYDSYSDVYYTITGPPSVTLTPSAPSPQAIGTSITFTAVGSGGTGSYNYEFYYQAPGSTSWVKAKAYSSTATWAWNTTGLATGTYQIVVWVKTNGTSPAAGYDSNTIINYTLNTVTATGVTLTPSVPSPQSVGTAVTMSASASGGTGSYEYEFYYQVPGSSTWVKAQSYSSLSSWSWNTAGLSAGIYQIAVWTRISGTTPAGGYDTNSVISYTLNPVVVTITGLSLTPSVPSPQSVGTAVTMSASASGGTGSYDYEFYYQAPGSTTWIKSQPYSATSSWSWNTLGLTAGTYQIAVWARNSGTTPASGYDKTSTISYALTPVIVTGVTLTPSIPSPQNVGSLVTMSASASGGTGSYQYEFYYQAPGSSTWIKTQPYSSSSLWNWNTTGLSAGTYQVTVWAKASGTTPAGGYDKNSIISYTVNPVTVTGVTLTPSAPSPQNVGSLVTMSASASGGTGSYDYEFYYQAPGSNAWVKAQTYSLSSSWIWNTSGLSAGTYQVSVWAKVSATTPVGGYDKNSVISYTLNPVTVTITGLTLTPGAPSPQNVGSSVSMSASASGGTGSYDYEFYYQSPGSTAWVKAQSYSALSGWNWNTVGLTAGTYQITVWARNSGTTPASGYDKNSTISYTLVPVTVTGVTLTPSVPSPQNIGALVTMSAVASGGTGSYQYEFYYQSPGSSTWVKAQAYSISSSWIWNTSGLPAGTYQIAAWAKSSGTTPAGGYDKNSVISYTLNSATVTSVILTPSVPSPQNIGSLVTMSALASGGTGSYQYEFYYLSPGSSTWVKAQAYSALSSWNWNTTGLPAGTYQIAVWSKTSGATPAAGYEKNSVISYIFNPVTVTGVTLTPSIPSPQNVGSLVTMSALASGGTGSYNYEFYYLAPGSSTWVKAQTYSPSSIWNWNTTGLPTGTYQIAVWSKTSGSTPAVGYDKNSLISYTLNPVTVTGVTLTPSVPSPQNVGTSVNLTASASGGTGSYQYEFYYLAPGSSTWVKAQAYSISSSWNWNTTGMPLGTYQIAVWSKTSGTTPAAGYDKNAIIAYSIK